MMHGQKNIKSGSSSVPR